MPQTAQTLADTVAQHVAYGNDAVSHETLQQALRLSGAADFIGRLSKGIDTEFNQGSSGFSGGQMQRLELARGLARQAPIIVLDEPTSNLDACIENAFRDTIAQLRATGDRTVIVVAHRLSFIRNADRIVVLENGTVREEGSHAELLANRNWYAHAWEQQHHAGPPISEVP